MKTTTQTGMITDLPNGLQGKQQTVNNAQTGVVMTTRFKNGTLLDALRRGNVSASDWDLYASSQKSLHVQISKLRKQGFDIRTHEGGWGTGKDVGKKPCIYELITEPEKETDDA
jgi:hypothetical protein